MLPTNPCKGALDGRRALITLVAVGIGLSPVPRKVQWEADATAVGLADGRRLAYLESGSRTGLTTLLFIHGCADSRLRNCLSCPAVC